MATLIGSPAVVPFDPASLSIAKRREYLRRLWHADIDPLVFLVTARRLGFTLRSTWNFDDGMPTLETALQLLH